MRSTQLVGHSLLVGLIVLQANVCWAQSNAPVELTWEAPKDCPQNPEVQQQLSALLPTSSADRIGTPFHARGVIEPSDGHYRLTLFIERGATHGARIIESDDCRSLAKAATIVLALLVQKERSLGRELLESEISGQPEQGPKPQDPTQKAREPQAPPAVEPVRVPPTAPETVRPWRLLVRAPEGRLDLLTLPRIGYGVGLGFGIAYYDWRAIINGTFYDTSKTTSSGTHPYEVAYRRKSFDGRICRGWRSGHFEVAPCGVIAADYLVAHASGEYLDSSDKTAIGISLGAGLSGYVHLQRHLALVATGTSRIMGNRARFSVENLTGKERTHQLPWLTLDISLACEWIF